MKKDILGLDLEELTEITVELGLPKFNAVEISKWIYQKGAKSFDEMSNLSKKARLALSDAFTIGLTPPVRFAESVDGTKKYLFKAGSSYVEAAYIPDKKRKTLCVSTQVGCKMGCLFCMTAKQGFKGQLTSGEILNQIISIPESQELTNLVFMGMGEPFDNLEPLLKSLKLLTSEHGLSYNPKKITVSTIGILQGIKRFIEETKCHLAISLHSPFDEERAQLMPAQNIYSISEIVEYLKQNKFEKQRRIFFEYIVFEGINDSNKHVNQLARLLNGLSCRINLLRFHEIPGTPLKGLSEDKLKNFKTKLEKKGIITTIRASRGEDILAACGLLSTKELENR